MDRTWWPNCLATKISRRHSNGFFIFILGQRQSLAVEDLRASITAAIATVTTEMLQRTWLNLTTNWISPGLLRETEWKCTDFLIETL
ncbi:hypothetical protein AVEN_81336-1 [Araneus ventricosus]|uniref:Uncharacterized protein n=1 Tax=Araneus ventricosus TaxID=182803 RepID=A0A4Y2B8I3_ARAVE|nr:hypothetical protein AVEN_81336-1 [Araneus ventricosus]